MKDSRHKNSILVIKKLSFVTIALDHRLNVSMTIHDLKLSISVFLLALLLHSGLVFV